MPKQIIIAEQNQVAAVYWEDQIQELVVATGNQQVSDIYLGIVENVISGIDAAFVNIGDAERNGFIHVTDLGPLRLKKTAGAITELLAPQQKVLVQVMKEPTGNKGPRLTGKISLPGRYLVLIPNGKGVNLSRRIRSEEERNRLRALAILTKPPGMGVLVRTEAEGKGEDAIIEDLEFLQKQWENVQQQSVATRAPALLNRDDDFIQRVLRDMYSGDVNRIVTDTQAGVKRVKQHLMGWGDGRVPEGVFIDSHREPQNILDYFRVNAAIREALKPRVDLPSGGYIIIEPTEALTVIDVNSGSFTRSATSRETVLWTNSEAATEIARQLRLRNIGGVIIVDFIDMDTRRDQAKLLEHFGRCLKSDKARPQIAQLSELGLVELTRKRQGQNLYELFGRPCPNCGGLGHLAELPGDSGIISLENTVSSLPSLTPRLLEKTPPLLSDLGFDTLPEQEESEPGEELDLLYHPNYQEQGGANRRRRRRRPEPFAKEPFSREDSSPTKIVPSLANKVIEPIVAVAATIPSPPVVIPAPGESVEEERKGRRERSHPRREEVVRERVSVEMTPREQEVYALMGASPLIRLEQEFKDPKSVIVSIRSLGEDEDLTSKIKALPEELEVQAIAPPMEEILSLPTPGVEVSENWELDDLEPSLTAIASEVLAIEELGAIAEEVLEVETIESSPFDQRPVYPGSVPEADIPALERKQNKSSWMSFESFSAIAGDLIEPPVVRRRRRRSSAQEDGDDD
ncbi:MAG: Rne/Rng family ribonuclease [Microcystaceae cyanobacterium]